MKIETEPAPAALKHECGKCRSMIILPEWVSVEEVADAVVFQCPNCDKEAEIDISHRPKTDVRLIVNGKESSSAGKRTEDVIRV